MSAVEVLRLVAASKNVLGSGTVVEPVLVCMGRAGQAVGRLVGQRLSGGARHAIVAPHIATRRPPPDSSAVSIPCGYLL